MRHFTKYTFTLLFISALVLPQFAFAAEAKFFGPLIPDECHCEGQVDPNGGTLTTAPGWGCVLQVVQNGINLAISLGVIIATLFFVYAGFVWMTSGGNPGKIEQGRTMILNVIIGLVVLLSAWLIVDFIMKTLYNDSGEFGPWNAILSGGSACLVARNPTPLTDGAVEIITSSGEVFESGATSGTGTGGGGNCTPIPDSQLVTVDGYRLTPDTASRFTGMKNAAAQNGVNLIITSGYRSPDDQLRAWNNNKCQLVNGKAVCGVRTAAVPCSLGGGGSNHTRGTAVDIRLNPGVYNWLKQNASRFGFFNSLPNDLPHWSDTGR